MSTTFDNSISSLVDKLSRIDLRPRLTLDTNPAVQAVTGIARSLDFTPEVGTLTDSIHAAVATMPSTPITIEPHLTELAALPQMTVDVEPHLLPLPKLDPISVDLVGKTATAAATATATTTNGGVPAVVGTQTLELDLTIVLEDGKTVSVTKTLPLPKPGDLKQSVKTEVHAS